MFGIEQTAHVLGSRTVPATARTSLAGFGELEGVLALGIPMEHVRAFGAERGHLGAVRVVARPALVTDRRPPLLHQRRLCQ